MILAAVGPQNTLSAYVLKLNDLGEVSFETKGERFVCRPVDLSAPGGRGQRETYDYFAFTKPLMLKSFRFNHKAG
jgi:hypothetical protein